MHANVYEPITTQRNPQTHQKRRTYRHLNSPLTHQLLQLVCFSVFQRVAVCCPQKHQRWHLLTHQQPIDTPTLQLVRCSVLHCVAHRHINSGTYFHINSPSTHQKHIDTSYTHVNAAMVASSHSTHSDSKCALLMISWWVRVLIL